MYCKGFRRFSAKKLNLFPNTLMVEIFIKPVTPFIENHCLSLLPDWQFPPQTVIIVLLPSPISLDLNTPEIELEKEKLRHHFLVLAQNIKAQLSPNHQLTEIIDPQDGYPLHTARGTLNFNIVEVVHQLLGFPYSATPEGCKVLHHPTWQTAVYPSLLIAQMSPKQTNKDPINIIENMNY